MTIKFSLSNLRASVLSDNRSYSEKMIERIAQDIKKRAISKEDSLWVTFHWEDGSYEEIINFFEERGVTVGCPTGPWEGGETSFLFSWDLDDPSLDRSS